MNNQDLAVVPVSGTSLQAYGEREQVRELADRLLALHPEAQKVGKEGMIAAAQLALMVGASPLPATNEVHVWRDNKDKICIQLGINYWRRKAAEWGGVLWRIQPRQMYNEEREQYAIAAGQLAAICKAVRSEDMIQYTQLGFAVADVWEMCGVIGVGVAGNNEYAKSGRPPIWSAMKRAETDLYRQLFPVQWANEAQKQHTINAERVMLRQEGSATMSYVVPVDMGEKRPSALPENYSVRDANRDLFGYEEPDDDPDGTIVIDAEDGIIEDAVDESSEQEPTATKPTKTAAKQPEHLYADGTQVEVKAAPYYEQYRQAHNGDVPESATALRDWYRNQNGKVTNGNGKTHAAGQDAEEAQEVELEEEA